MARQPKHFERSAQRFQWIETTMTTIKNTLMNKYQHNIKIGTIPSFLEFSIYVHLRECKEYHKLPQRYQFEIRGYAQALVDTCRGLGL
jgi:hypothetical protein